MSCIPVTIIGQIYGYLDVLDVIRGCRTVSKHWGQCKAQWEKLKVPSWCLRMIQNQLVIKKLSSIHLIGDVQDEHMCHIGLFPHLHDIDLSCSHVTDQGLAYIGSLEHLRVLDNCTKITDRGLESIAFLEKLQTLDLWGCKITDRGLETIGSIRQLRSLDIGWNHNITDRGLASIARLTQLRDLSLHECVSITDQGLASITTLTQLQSLDLSDCTQITDRGICYIRCIAQLSHLDLRRCTGIRDTGDREHWFDNTHAIL
jgi:hypothetical protein